MATSSTLEKTEFQFHAITSVQLSFDTLNQLKYSTNIGLIYLSNANTQRVKMIYIMLMF